MLKKLLVLLIFIALVMISCDYNEHIGKDNQVISSNVGSESITDSNTKDNYDSTIWVGKWSFGDSNNLGNCSTIEISDLSNNIFGFSILATYAYIYGEGLQNANVGQLEGIANIISDNEASYISDEYPDYMLEFTISNDKLIIKEVNVKTKEYYGISPYAGMHVTFSGEYGKSE